MSARQTGHIGFRTQRQSAFRFCIMGIGMCVACGGGSSAPTSEPLGQTTAPPTAATGPATTGASGVVAAGGRQGASGRTSTMVASANGAGASGTVPMPSGAAAGSAGVGVEATGNAGSAPTTRVNPGVPPEVAQSATDWPLPGRDYSNSRYTQDTRINSTNVMQLQEAWRFTIQGLVIAYGQLSTVPLIANGAVYVGDLWSGVHVIDLATGKAKWEKQDSTLNPGPAGVAVGWGKVFHVRGSDTVVAYDAASGKELWTKKVTDTATAGIDIQPTVFDDKVGSPQA